MFREHCGSDVGKTVRSEIPGSPLWAVFHRNGLIWNDKEGRETTQSDHPDVLHTNKFKYVCVCVYNNDKNKATNLRVKQVGDMIQWKEEWESRFL